MVWALLLIGLLFLVLLGFALRKCEPLVRPALAGKLFDTLIGIRPAAIRQLHSEYAAVTDDAARRRALYLEETRWDNVFAAGYTGWLLCWWAAKALAWGGQQPFSGLNIFVIGMAIALVGGASDVVENQLIAVILRAPPGKLSASLVFGVGVATNLKWLAGAVGIMLLLFAPFGQIAGAH